MGDIFNTDFRDFIKSLNGTNVSYLLIGGYSVILHGYSRTTGDMDILVEKTEENYHRLLKAFMLFGMPVFDMTLEKFMNSSEQDVFTFGRQPVAIDIMTQVKGASFEALKRNAITVEIEGLSIQTISLKSLLELKAASGRSKDQDDIEHLS